MKNIGVELLSSFAHVPFRGSAKAAGLDLFTPFMFDLPAGKQDIIPLRIILHLPEGHYGKIEPRSGLAHLYGIDVMGGVIDEDYRGELKVILINHGKENVSFSPLDRIAQLIVQPYNTAPCQNFTSKHSMIEDSGRGNKGFGSTGR